VFPNRCGEAGEQIKLLSISEIKPRSVDRPARSTVIIPIELSRIPQGSTNHINDKEVTKLKSS